MTRYKPRFQPRAKNARKDTHKSRVYKYKNINLQRKVLILNDARGCFGWLWQIIWQMGEP